MDDQMNSIVRKLEQLADRLGINDIEFDDGKISTEDMAYLLDTALEVLSIRDVLQGMLDSGKGQTPWYTSKDPYYKPPVVTTTTSPYVHTSKMGGSYTYPGSTTINQAKYDKNTFSLYDITVT